MVGEVSWLASLASPEHGKAQTHFFFKYKVKVKHEYFSKLSKSHSFFYIKKTQNLLIDSKFTFKYADTIFVSLFLYKLVSTD